MSCIQLTTAYNVGDADAQNYTRAKIITIQRIDLLANEMDVVVALGYLDGSDLFETGQVVNQTTRRAFRFDYDDFAALVALQSAGAGEGYMQKWVEGIYQKLLDDNEFIGSIDSDH